jgi:hypothetical protein
VFFPAYEVGVNSRVKGVFHLTRGAAELDGHPALPQAVHAKTVGLEPASNLLKIASGNAKLHAEFSGRKPGVKIR